MHQTVYVCWMFENLLKCWYISRLNKMGGRGVHQILALAPACGASGHFCLVLVQQNSWLISAQLQYMSATYNWKQWNWSWLITWVIQCFDALSTTADCITYVMELRDCADYWWNRTRKPCCCKETAQCRGCSFRFKIRRRHSLQSLRVDKLRKPGFRAPNIPTQNRI